MDYNTIDFAEDIIEKKPTNCFPMTTYKFDASKNIIQVPYQHSDYYNEFMRRDSICHLNKLDKRLERYDLEDEMSFGINRMNEFDRGYYHDNPYCYSWEVDAIPLKYDTEYEGSDSDEDTSDIE